MNMLMCFFVLFKRLKNTEYNTSYFQYLTNEGFRFSHYTQFKMLTGAGLTSKLHRERSLNTQF